MKLLLYCTKEKPYLYKLIDKYSISQSFMEDALNGKIVAECDYEVEEISVTYADYYHEELAYDTNTLTFDELLEKSCLNNQQLDNYLYGDNGYAIHIKNLHIFDKPRKLNEFYKYNYKDETWSPVNKAPQNMMQVDYINIENDIFLPCILIPVHSELLCKILNDECSIIIRKKVLKEM